MSFGVNANAAVRASDGALALVAADADADAEAAAVVLCVGAACVADATGAHVGHAGHGAAVAGGHETAVRAAIPLTTRSCCSSESTNSALPAAINSRPNATLPAPELSMSALFYDVPAQPPRTKQ